MEILMKVHLLMVNLTAKDFKIFLMGEGMKVSGSMTNNMVKEF